MIIKEYRRAKYIGEPFFGEWMVLEPGKTYGGSFLIMPDNIYGEGCVLFHIGKTKGLTGKGDRFDWEFKSRYAV